MEKFNIEMRFFIMKKLLGEMMSAENRTGIYRIDITTNQRKSEQIKTAYHEFTHLISDLFFGALYIKGDEEDLCKEVENEVAKIIKKYTKKTLYVAKKKRKRRKSNGNKGTDKN